MNQDNNRSCNYELLPLAVIEAVHAGDPSAMDRVLRHYDRYIKKLCTCKLSCFPERTGKAFWGHAICH